MVLVVSTCLVGVLNDYKKSNFVCRKFLLKKEKKNYILRRRFIFIFFSEQKTMPINLNKNLLHIIRECKKIFF